MLSPRDSREHQQSWWSQLKTPAAVSLACLAATLLIAAQAFRSQPASKSSALNHNSNDYASKSNDYGSNTVTTGASTTAETVVALQGSDVVDQLLQGEDLQKREQASNTAEPLAGSGKEKEQDQSATSTKLPEAFVNVTAVQENIGGMEVVIINDTLSGYPPKGVLLLFHGCSHSAGDWWFPSPSCPSCRALPEELAITKAALKRNFAVVAFSSMDRDLHRCWDTTFPPEKSVDIQSIAKAWQELLERDNNWNRIPHYALGGSSGGALVLYLAQRIPLDGVCPVIMAVQPQTLDVKPRTFDSSKSWNYPPTFFISMERDEMTLEGVAADVAILKRQGIPVNEIVVKPRPLTPTFFWERVEGIDNSTSATMYNALLAEGCINSTGHLVDNPRSLVMLRKWQKALRERVPGTKGMNFNKDESPVFEELNLAWASHELVSDHIDEVLDWFTVRKDGPKLMTAVNPRRQLQGDAAFPAVL